MEIRNAVIERAYFDKEGIMDPETRERLDMLVRAREWQSQYPKKAEELRRIVRRRIINDMRTEGLMEQMTPAQATQEANARLRELEGQA